MAEDWIDIGSTDELSKKPVSKVTAKMRELAVSFKDGTFGVVSNACNMSAGRSAKAASTATTSTAPGTTGNSTVVPASASRASKRTPSPRTL